MSEKQPKKWLTWIAVGATGLGAASTAVSLAKGGVKVVIDQAQQAKDVRDTKAMTMDLETKFDGHEKRLSILEVEEGEHHRQQDKRLDELKSLIIVALKDRKHG
jgi:hypothetical protein